MKQVSLNYSLPTALPIILCHVEQLTRNVYKGLLNVIKSELNVAMLHLKVYFKKIQSVNVFIAEDSFNMSLSVYSVKAVCSN